MYIVKYSVGCYFSSNCFPKKVTGNKETKESLLLNNIYNKVNAPNSLAHQFISPGFRTIIILVFF